MLYREFNNFEKPNTSPVGKTKMAVSLKKFLILFCLFLFPEFYSAHPITDKITIVVDQSSLVLNKSDFVLITEAVLSAEQERPTPLLHIFHTKQKKNKKLTAALLAFPFPFGIVGLHRIYLGCAPYVPVVYIATFGGIVGLLPLVDFCFILLEKDMKPFTDNKKVFMWVN